MVQAETGKFSPYQENQRIWWRQIRINCQLIPSVHADSIDRELKKVQTGRWEELVKILKQEYEGKGIGEPKGKKEAISDSTGKGAQA